MIMMIIILTSDLKWLGWETTLRYVSFIIFLKVVTSSLHCPGNFPNTAKNDLEVYKSKFSGIKDYKTESIRKSKNFNFHWTETL